MTTTIDNQVVQLGFDNAGFEKGVKTSLDSINMFKKSLDFTESAKGFEELQNGANKFNLDSIASGVDAISSKFSVWGVVGLTVIQNLANAAINLGKTLYNKTLEPIRMGFSEYETQMNAIQTVLANTASKGTTLDDVSAALRELNTYADQTIYNFTEMTRNIGTFTAAGVDLDTSTAAIKGIANLAAVSGSNAQQASTAMYQLSQALSSGTVKLMDWNSVVNAGMGGQVFQDALKETARVSGVAIDQLIDKHGSFRETLQTGWLSSDVLLATLQKFTGDLTEEQLISIGYTEEQIAAILKLGETANDAATKVKTFTQLKDTLAEALQSGWTQSWEIILGDFEEAKAFFTYMSDTIGGFIGASAEARNSFLADWKEAGGRSHLVYSVKYAFEALVGVADQVKIAFKNIFPEEFTGLDLARITIQIREFVKGLILTEDQADKVRRIFEGVFSVFSIFKDIVVNLAGVIFGFGKTIDFTRIDILGFLANIGDSVTAFKDSIDIAKGFEIAIASVGKAFTQIGDSFTAFSEMLKNRFGIDLNVVKDNIIAFFMSIPTIIAGAFVMAGAKIEEFIGYIQGKFGEFGDWFTDMFIGADGGAAGIDGWVQKMKDRFEPFTAFGDILATSFSKFLVSIGAAMPFLTNLKDSIFEFLDGLGIRIAESFKDVDYSTVYDIINGLVLGGIALLTGKFVSGGGGIFKALLDILIGGGGFIKTAGEALEGIKDVLDGVRGTLEAWQQNLRAKTLFTIASAIGILALSLIAISLIDSEKLMFSIGAITALMVNLMGAMAALGKAGGVSGGLGQSAALVGLSVSIFILVGALALLSTVDKDRVDDGLLAMAGMAAGMVALSYTMSQNAGNIAKGAIGMGILAVALIGMIGALKLLTLFEPEELDKGMRALGAMLGGIAAFLLIVNNTKFNVGSAVAVGVIAGALYLMAFAIERIGGLDMEVLKKGLGSIGALLLAIGVFAKFTSGGDLMATSLAIAVFAGSAYILAEAMIKMSDLSWEEIGRGLAVMGGSLALIAGAVKLLPKDMIFQAVGLTVVAASLLILAEALTRMSELSWEEIGRGLAALGGSLLILAGGLYLMSGTMAGSIALAVAAASLMLLVPVFKSLGKIKIGELGMALLSLVGIFTVLGIAGAILTPVIPTLIGLGVAMTLLGVGAALVGVGLLAFSAGLAALAISGAAGGQAIALLVTTIANLLPIIAVALVDVLVILVAGIITLAPLLGEAITAILTALLEAIIAITPLLGAAIILLGLELLNVIQTLVPPLVETIMMVIQTILDALVENVPVFVQSGFDLLLGILQGIRDNIGEVVITVGEIITEFLSALALVVPDIIQAGFDLLVSFLQGLTDAINDETNKNTITTVATDLVTALVDGLVTGVGSLGKSFIDAVIQLAKDAIKGMLGALNAQSPSKEFYNIGQYIPQGLIGGVKSLSNKFGQSVADLGRTAIGRFEQTMSGLADALSTDLDLNPEIRPVLDMSDVIAGGGLLDSLFGARTLTLDTAMREASKASDIGSGMTNGESVSGGSTNITLNQNNYSPTALDTLEIYRQTRNQMLTLKGVVT